ncbi:MULTISPECIES: CRISPR-associated helicase Cas3' [Clostridium]|uniref:CRISPR-associated helicase Cas3' n=3 Tax=Clostridiaceae TaxID=31979 RepID=UPI00082293AB|nr:MULTISPECIES: CRISPR-associated helicase Cas3' [Clostridium]MBX9185501.1 CRISPR-associated helicase Cas3' [Clostridium sp. K04]MDU7453613.1 CRISPR-associated helicase Cas3' [Clostridium saudiense]SCJ24014.1 helicase Cas3 [uncultured Clostridium sp.]
MEERFKILDIKTLELIENKLAKPDKTIKQHTEELLKCLDLLLELGYIKKGEIYNLVEKACIYHDLGKLNDEFQKRVKSKTLKFNEDKEVVHNVLSLYFIDSKMFTTEADYLKVAHSVLNHHSYGNVFEILNEKEELIKSLVKDFNIYKIKRSIKTKLVKKELINNPETIKIKGYLHKCDYSASAGNVAEYPNSFLEEALKNLLIKWKKENNNTKWNELQKFALENKNENIIAIAQTGMGKTEAGFLWMGNTKGFFVLPIRTAINAIYDRARKNILNNDKIEEKIAILHSSSLEYYLRNISNDMSENEDILNYHTIGRQLSIPINITTMDQIFDFVFKYPSYELKLTTLGYSKIVIDEIQAYSADLLAYLIYGLEKVNEQGGKIAILTATLPPFIKDLLKKNMDFKENENAFTSDVIRHNLKVINERISSDDIYEKYNENKKLNKNNKVLIVCNTIKEAQKIYNQLKGKVDEKELNILHSKFIRKERLEKEEDIIEFGKTYDEEKNIDKKSGIWISTSIVEASLDIDFDYLFTELQDLNSLFQRLGRCNRKGKKDSKDYNCYVYTKIEESNLVDGKRGFIDRSLFNLSKEAIEDLDGQLSEKEKVSLIEKYLTTENLKDSDYMRKYNKEYEFINDIEPYKFQVNDVNLRNILSEEIIPSPIYEKYLSDITELENKLKDREISIIERVKLKDKIKQYTVSVHPIDVKNYEFAVQSGKAIHYKKVMLSNNVKDYIKVIECEYDEVGYKRMRYDKQTRNSAIW